MVDAMLIGIAQIGALIPGVSRSGSTLTAALALGFKRDEAARLSFLLGLPAIALAGLREIWELYKIRLDGHGDTRMVEQHYGHLAPSFITDAIRAGAPRFSVATPAAVTPLHVGKSKRK